jgi:diguanylate cyclase (GGDEF)-like protein
LGERAVNLRGISAQRTGKVLVVNADSEVSRILEVNLRHADFDVVTAYNWEETLNRVDNDRLDIILLDPDLPDIDDAEIYRQLKRLPQVNYIPIILIGTSHKAKSRSAKLENIADHYISKPFNTKDVVAVVQEYIARKELAGNINPLTGLPNQAQISNEISRLIEKKAVFAAIYIAMADLRIFNKVYGYAQGDRVIRLLGEIISEAVRLFGNPDDLVGHIGGDKFIAISTPGKARLISRRIIADYNRRIKSLYSDEHLQKGYIAWENPLGVEEQSPIMTLRVAVVTSQKRSFNHHIEVIEALTEQMDFLKLFPGDKSFYDLQGSSFDENLAVYYRGVPNVQREGVKAMHGVFKWLDFLIQEMNIPIMAMNDSLVAVRRQNIENLSFEEQNS